MYDILKYKMKTMKAPKMTSTKTAKKLEFLAYAAEKFGASGTYSRSDMIRHIEKSDDRFRWSDCAWVLRPAYRDLQLGRGFYKLPTVYKPGSKKVKAFDKPLAAKLKAPVAKLKAADKTPVAPLATAVAVDPSTVDMAVVAFPAAVKASPTVFDPNVVSQYDLAKVPARDPLYVPFGDFSDVEVIMKSHNFFPLFVVGMSGNGKTFMIEQAASRARRPLIRIQMSRETDEDDLVGGFRLVNGETKFIKGPAIRAMEQGAILLIDEADRSDPGKVMCLQGILEGKPYYIKKTGELIAPKSGFNIIATANTKGRGSDDGRYVAAGILDDAWLERFPITIEQMFPSPAIETRILNGYLCANRDCTDEDRDFVTHLVAWSSIIRKSFDEQAVDDIISTRRLVHIINTYIMFGDRMRAIKLCINRFDTEIKNTFIELYTKVDPTLAPPTQEPMPSPDGMVPQSTDAAIPAVAVTTTNAAIPAASVAI